MNELTRQLVAQVALENKAEAKRNDEKFRWFVECAHHEYLINEYGWKLKNRYLEWLKIYKPTWFEDGYLRDYIPAVADFDVKLSGRIVSKLERKARRNPELTLHYDWGNLPLRTVEPQLSMF